MRVKLTGNDNRGSVFMDGSQIIREVDSVYMATAVDTVGRLERMGERRVVGSKRISDSEFEHEKLVITYPSEWSPSMVRDAALAQLDLSIEFRDSDLALKDAIPSNYLFRRGLPVLVDVLSVVSLDRLGDEDWLVAIASGGGLHEAVLRSMFIPFFGVPLLLASVGDEEGARRSIARSMHPKEPARDGWRTVWHSKGAMHRRLRALARYGSMRLAGRRGDLQRLRRVIASVPVVPKDRGYLDYYKAKGESFDFGDRSNWKPKQLSVANVLSRLSPAVVLDLGANTGWFSMLAAASGASVIAADIDVSCVDALHRRAQAEQLDITSIRLTFSEIEGSLPDPDESLEAAVRKHGRVPASVRLQADLVLCLGLVHHLTLGEGRDLATVLRMLHTLARGHCLVEFISMRDPLIERRPDYFANLSRFRAETYNEEAFEREARRLFEGVEKMPSHPETRTLWLLSRKRIPEARSAMT